MFLPSDDVIRAALRSSADFERALKDSLDEKGISAKEFAKRAGLPTSTLYKVLSGARKDPNLSTFRQIISALRRLEGVEEEEDTIAVIATRAVLDLIKDRTIELNGKSFSIREYPATSIEDCIIAAVKAEREQADAIVCAPIVSTTIEKIVNIPVAVMMPKESLARAIKLAAQKVIQGH